MVAGVDDAGCLREAGFLQCGQHAADIVVEEGAEAVIGGDGDPARLVVEEAVIGLGLGIGLDPGMARPAPVVPRQGHVRRVVKGEEGLGRDQREMRADEGDEQHPRALRRRSLFAQPAHRLVRDRPVVAGVAALAGADLARELRPAETDRHGVLDRAVHIALAVHDMQRADLGVEAGRVRLVAVMQLADGEHRAARRLQRMAPAGHAAVIGVAVVPGADLVDMAPGGEGGAGGHADRRGRVGAGKERAARRQRVQVRRLHDGMARNPHGIGAMLVGHDEKQVLRLHGAASLRPERARAIEADCRPLSKTGLRAACPLPCRSDSLARPAAGRDGIWR